MATSHCCYTMFPDNIWPLFQPAQQLSGQNSVNYQQQSFNRASGKQSAVRMYSCCHNGTGLTHTMPSGHWASAARVNWTLPNLQSIIPVCLSSLAKKNVTEPAAKDKFNTTYATCDISLNYYWYLRQVLLSIMPILSKPKRKVLNICVQRMPLCLLQTWMIMWLVEYRCAITYLSDLTLTFGW